MSASPFRRFAHRVLAWSGPVLLALVAIYQFLVWQSERWWFESLGYGAHFGRLFGWRVAAFVLGALPLGLWLGVNAQIAWRNAALRAVPLSFFQSDDALRLIPLEDKLHLDRYRRRTTFVIVAALSWMAGLGFSSRAALFVGAFGVQSSGIRDSASNFDLAFFLFALPFYAYLARFLLFAIVAALLLVTAIYLYEETIGPRVDAAFLAGPMTPMPAPRVGRAAAKHLAVLWAILLLWKGLECVLGVPQSFVSSGSVGTRVFDSLDIYFGWTSAALFAFSAPLVAFLSSVSIAREPRYRTFALGLLWMVCAGSVPAILPLVVPRPPENSKWKTELTRHIGNTRRAWNLDDVTQRSFALAPKTGFRAVSIAATGEAQTAAPLALWSALAARIAFNRQLEARGSNRRVSRVWLERAGQNLIYCGLAMPPKPAAPKSWRARHEREENGALVRMEANRAAPDGTPVFLPDGPAAALLGGGESDISALRARAWTGQTALDDAFSGDNDEWILAPALVGNGDEGAARGVNLGDWRARWLLAARFLDPLLARETNADDEIIWHRGAAERCRELAPFLDWRSAEARPVWVGADSAAGANFGARGELKWLVPGLIWSDDYPDSAAPAPLSAAPVGANYGRHVAAGVVDAQTGAVTLYLLEENEPFVALYARAFPELFALPTAIPTEIRAALRPSSALLSAQSLIWARYHETEPLAWLARRSDYRPLFSAADFSPGSSGAAPPSTLASQPSGDWNLTAYARPESQIQRGPMPPLAAILGFDERDFAASGTKMRLVEWRPRALLELPSILADPLDEKPLSKKNVLPPMPGVAPNFDAQGEARGLFITRGLATFPTETVANSANASTPRQIQLQISLQISGPAPRSAPAASSAQVPPRAQSQPMIAAQGQLQEARAAWRRVRDAREKADWKAVARAEKQLETILESAP